MTGIIDFGLPILVSGGGTVGAGDFDYIFQFPDAGTFLRDPIIASVAPQATGIMILVYNPVETVRGGAIPATPNALVSLPQLACSTVALPQFWVILTALGLSADLTGHPNIQIVNNRRLMFARQPSVVQTKIDVTHINIMFNPFGLYVADGLQVIPTPPAPTGTGIIDFGMPILEIGQGG